MASQKKEKKKETFVGVFQNTFKVLSLFSIMWWYLIIRLGVVVKAQYMVEEDMKLWRHVFQQHPMVISLFNLPNLLLRKTEEKKNRFVLLYLFACHSVAETKPVPLHLPIAPYAQVSESWWDENDHGCRGKLDHPICHFDRANTHWDIWSLHNFIQWIERRTKWYATCI